jgi:hypothetical protein
MYFPSLCSFQYMFYVMEHKCQVLTLYICVALVDNHGEVMWCFSDQTSQTDFLEAPVSNQWSLFHVSNLCPISSRSVLGINTEYISGIT